MCSVLVVVRWRLIESEKGIKWMGKNVYLHGACEAECVGYNEKEGEMVNGKCKW